MPEENSKPSLIDWVKVLAIPLSIAIGGWWVSSISSHREAEAAARQLESGQVIAQEQVAATYVEMSIDILRRPLPSEDLPPSQVAAELSLREWAVDVLAFGSPVQLTSEVAGALLAGEVTLPGTVPAPTGLKETNQGIDASGRPFIGLGWSKSSGIPIIQVERDGVIVHADDNLAFRDVPTPAVNPGQVLIYRIRSMADDQVSRWSDPVTVVVDPP